MNEWKKFVLRITVAFWVIFYLDFIGSMMVAYWIPSKQWWWGWMLGRRKKVFFTWIRWMGKKSMTYNLIIQGGGKQYKKKTSRWPKHWIKKKTTCLKSCMRSRLENRSIDPCIIKFDLNFFRFIDIFNVEKRTVIMINVFFSVVQCVVWLTWQVIEHRHAQVTR